MNNEKIIIFTDMDGTLLDHQTYTFSEAEEALRLIREKEVTLVLCSSKTRDEIEVYRKKLSNNEPFISENGGAIFIPEQYEGLKCKYDKIVNGYLIIEIGTDFKTLADTFKRIKSSTGVDIKGINEFSTDEVVRLTGLSEEEACLAVKREYSLPFIIKEGEKDAGIIKGAITSSGFTYTEGARFMHLMGANDKGKAVKILTDIFRENQPDVNITTAGLGDSLNDLPMLETVDRPFLVRKVLGNYDERIKVKDLVYADGIGPAGWNKAVTKLLNKT